MNGASNEYKKQFIDFSAGNPEFDDLASIQQEGSIALYNILNKDADSIAYLADEVGMGKTFIALGTVMLMRYLNPTLRVLYIAPNRQLKDQWIEEYQRFIKNHVKLSHGHIRSFSGDSAVPYADCKSLSDLIKKTTSGYFADYFVQMNSFSFAMSDNTKEGDKFYRKHLKELEEYIPAYTDSVLSSDNKIESKDEVKQHYALALNYLLPKFDLIVVDEAHKFKNGIRSSTRNQMLSLILGTSDKGIGQTSLSNEQKLIHKKLTSKTLLLSATPFDRNLEHIRNQIELFSGITLAQKYFPKDSKGKIKFSIKQKEKLKQTLRTFLVRRLNNVKIGNDIATRNMYRVEHRDDAVELKGFQNKLVMALVQKHVGDLIEDRQTSSPSFQMGLLASFESFADSAGVKVFDGDEKVSEGKDQARDANLIQKLNNSYKESFGFTTMPHPKMDEVVHRHSSDMFANGEKHLFFVRRVKSVSELVSKWNENYNTWLKKYLIDSKTNLAWDKLFYDYFKEDITLEIKSQDKKIDDDYETDEITKDTFFSWFFRGSSLGEGTTYKIDYKDFKKNMTKKDNNFSLFFEINWVQYLNTEYDIESRLFKKLYLEYYHKDKSSERFNRYHTAQYAALGCMNDIRAKKIIKIMYGELPYSENTDETEFNIGVIKQDLSIKSIFNELNIIQESFVETFILKELLLIQFRQDHLMIDLYISLLKSGQDKNDKFIDEFIKIYKGQKDIKSIVTSYSVINNVKENIQLICETTLQKFTKDINNIVPKGLVKAYNRKNIKLNIGRFDPVVGVSGDTGDKTLYARKFRLPGYPIVMIATDVMQEGVNLHTFCRSVTHYGLSGTPIHIEQKNGRVDRINSLTHRKIQNNNYKSLDDFHSEKIQVRFPFVRQSYESFQVRRLASNLNDYLESLHDIEIENNADDRVYLDKEFQDGSSIPKAYTEYLKTPFEIADDQKKIPSKLFKIIKSKSDEKSKLIKLLSMHIENLFGDMEDIENLLIDGEKLLLKYESEFYMQLKPAKSNGEFLLEFTKVDEDSSDVVEFLVGSDTYIETDEQLTHEDEILGAVERLFTKIQLTSKRRIDISRIESIKRYWECRDTIPFARSGNITFEFENSSIVFEIGELRKHTVDLYIIDICNREYILFHTKVCKNNNDVKIEKTVDIVKFQHEDDYIIGYVLHDLNNIQPKEFMYSAYVLAVEADIFEYQLSLEDKY